MRRRLIHILTGISLALLLVVGVFYVRSYRVGHGFSFLYSHRTPTRGSTFRYGISFTKGLLRVGRGETFALIRDQADPDWMNYQVHPHFEHARRVVQSDTPAVTFVPEFDPYYVEHRDHPSIAYRLGFGYGFLHYPDGNGGDDTYSASMPLWFVCLCLAALPAWWLLTFPKRRRRGRVAAGLCPQCAYDLRTQLAGTAGNKCPECGVALSILPHNIA